MEIVKPLMYYLLEKLLTCKSNFTVFSLCPLHTLTLTFTRTLIPIHILYMQYTNSTSLCTSVCGHRFISIFHLPMNIIFNMMFNDPMNLNYIQLKYVKKHSNINESNNSSNKRAGNIKMEKFSFLQPSSSSQCIVQYLKIKLSLYTGHTKWYPSVISYFIIILLKQIAHGKI